jgi:hypothetical protein
MILTNLISIYRGGPHRTADPGPAPPAGHPGVIADIPHLGPESMLIATQSVVGVVELAVVTGGITGRAVHWAWIK